MKKVTYLFVLMFSLVLMSTSCCKPDDDTPLPKVVTVNDLVGNWTCVSLNYNGTLYDTPAEFDQLNLTKDFVNLNFNFTSTTSVTLSTNYTGTNSHTTWSGIYPFALSNNVITITNAGIEYLKFQLMNTETFNGTELVLQMTKGNADMPVGGTYTLTK